MASNYLAIVAGIKAVMQGVPGIGTVHDRSRLAADWAAYIARFRDPATGRIHGWEITRVAVPEHLRGVTFRHHVFALRGYLGIEDAAATDHLFQVLIDEVCAAFRTAAPPNAATWEYHDGDAAEQGPAQVRLIDERTFGAVLCHHAEIHLSVSERIV